jgi:hypothetical protein
MQILKIPAGRVSNVMVVFEKVILFLSYNIFQINALCSICYEIICSYCTLFDTLERIGKGLQARNLTAQGNECAALIPKPQRGRNIS